MTGTLHYNVNLPEDLSSILEQDFWMLESVGGPIISSLTQQPIKFAASTWIVVYHGEFKADINLKSYDFKGPALINVRSTQIMQPQAVSPDLEAAVMVFSKRISENLLLFVNNTPLASVFPRHPVVPIPAEIVPAFREFFDSTRQLLNDITNPYGSQALLHQILLFIFETGYKCFLPYKDEVRTKPARLSDHYLELVQENFRKERFLDFYADKLEITTKHLSRTVRQQTGYTAVDWIERFVILEAKVLLKSSNLTIQQISDELNFPSQSFFGKYFKKVTGMSPTDFRNS